MSIIIINVKNDAYKNRLPCYHLHSLSSISLDSKQVVTQTHLQCGAIHDEVICNELSNLLFLGSSSRVMYLGQRVVGLNQRIKVRLMNYSVAERTRHVWIHLGFTHTDTIYNANSSYLETVDSCSQTDSESLTDSEFQSLKHHTLITHHDSECVNTTRTAQIHWPQM